jgi:hypothetical protein
MDEDSIDNEALDVLLNAGSRWVLYLLLAIVVAMVLERRPSLGASTPVFGAGAAMLGMMMTGSSHASFGAEAGFAQLAVVIALGMIVAWSSAPRREFDKLFAQ